MKLKLNFLAGSLQLSEMDTTINAQASTEERPSNHISLEEALSAEVHIELSGGSLQRSETDTNKNVQASTPFESGVGETYNEMIEGDMEATNDASAVASDEEFLTS
ncbi:hypothetical protein JTB14_010736 [Gonioctena quinquepunctata]|nr:hypothetical protein JTB14_010736 [Gonioctena quinquepunctata]